VIELTPDDAAAWFKRGNVHLDLNEYESAAFDYGQAIRLNPDHAIALFNRSIAYGQLGKRALSAQDRARALKLDPTLAKSTSR
jgi:tetratricopeptide (TPR) repeat protein